MDFEWGEAQIAFQKSVVQFARNELHTDLVEQERKEQFSRENWKKCGDFGLPGLPAPPEYGGSGADILSVVGAFEALGSACQDNGLIFSLNAHLWGSVLPVSLFGTEHQKERYLPLLVNGDWIGGHAVSEPASGSDVFSMRTRAEWKNGRYVLNGSKTFITNGPIADVLVIYAATDPSAGPSGITAFLLEKGTPGFTAGPELHKMGLRTSPMSELAFADCEVPAENVLKSEGAGPAIFAASMEWERICILASCLGTMQRLVEVSARYARQRHQFGHPIAEFPPIAGKIADMEIRLETSRLILYKSAWLAKQGKHPLREAAIAKAYVSEACVETCQDAIQIHGGYGYMTEYQIERELRDAIASKIYSGTTEIQKNIIAGLRGVS